MITCGTCITEYNIRPLTLDEIELYSVMRYNMSNKSYYCNEDCYNKICHPLRAKRIHRPLIDSDGFTLVSYKKHKKHRHTARSTMN
jgi:hypothetical protein